MAKKILTFLMATLLIFLLAACGNTAQQAENSSTLDGKVKNTETITEIAGADASESAEPEATATDGKRLVVYFSWSTSGNTEKMATYLQNQTGADILELIPSNPYPTDYNETGDVAKVERDENARPEISNLPKSISEYKKILIGYPIWWHTAPMIIGTFLEHYDLTDVEIYPFSQSASMDTEQFDNSMDFVKENAKGANVHDGLFVESSDTSGILDYLKANNLVK